MQLIVLSGNLRQLQSYLIKAKFTWCQTNLDPVQNLYQIGLSFTRISAIWTNFVPPIRASFVPAKKQVQFCTCTGFEYMPASCKHFDRPFFFVPTVQLRLGC